MPGFFVTFIKQYHKTNSRHVIYLLKDQHPKLMEKPYKRFLVLWFFTRFDAEDQYQMISPHVDLNERSELIKHPNDVAYINGKGYSEYIQYQELYLTQETEINAQNNAKKALIISIFILGISVTFSVIQIVQSLLPISQVWAFIFQ